MRKHQAGSPGTEAAKAVKAVGAGIDALTDNAVATVAKAKSQASATVQTGKDKVHAARDKIAQPTEAAKAKAASLKTDVQDAADRGRAKVKGAFGDPTRTP